MQQLKLKIHGQVQGVSFRYYTKEIADSLGLKGYVKNLPNDTLEIVALGSKEKLQGLINWCREGPGLAKVEDLETVWQEANEDYNNFTIEY